MHKLPKNLLCFSHLRWDFVYQRPQHLMTRFSEFKSVFFLEEPVFGATDQPYMVAVKKLPNLTVLVPHLPEGPSFEQSKSQLLTGLISNYFGTNHLRDFIFWYYTPMALQFSNHYTPAITVYDCMDELSAFKFAPPELKHWENVLFQNADVVFTGGHSLYEAKKSHHRNIHPFPSSIDKIHFSQGRENTSEPDDQAWIEGPKLGFYGVIDERFNMGLIEEIATSRPEWQIMLIGPTAKIDPKTLPRSKNIHYLGPKSYDDLPLYLSGWDVALIPFLLNESTRFISPTKTPEYLSAGKPVISTAIQDVVKPYGEMGLVAIGHDANDFIKAIDKLLESPRSESWLNRVDEFLANDSWDKTSSDMMSEMEAAMMKKIQLPAIHHPSLPEATAGLQYGSFAKLS